MPLPFCRAAIVVGPAKEGIQKKPSVRSPLMFNAMFNYTRELIEIGGKECKNRLLKKKKIQQATSSATFERALYRPIHTGIVARVGRHPGK